MGRRSGFTLVETLLAVIIVGVMTLMAYPRVSSAMIKSDLRGARTRIVNMLSTARAAATQGNRTTALTFNGNTAVVTASPRRLPGGNGGNEDTLGVVVNLNTAYGATLATDIAFIKYDPRGFATGFDAVDGTTILLTRGSYSEDIVIDRLGRVTK